MNTAAPGASSSPVAKSMTVKFCRTFSTTPERRLPSSPTRLTARAPSASSSPMKGLWRSFPTNATPGTQFPHDAGLYKMRNIVERFFCTMKDMRRIATRFEKLSQNFLAMIHIFAIRLWIN